MEKEHFQVSIDLKVVEELRDDAKILQAVEKLKMIEGTLTALYAQLPDGK